MVSFVGLIRKIGESNGVNGEFIKKCYYIIVLAWTNRLRN